MDRTTDLDSIDRAILGLLEENARRTISDIAACVNLSPAPVRRRIDRLEQAGVIASYTVVTDLPAVAPHFEAFTEVKIDGDADPDEVIAGVTQIPEVLEVFTTAGDLDALVRIRVDNVDHLRRVVGAIRRLGRVSGTRTLIVLDSWARRGTAPAMERRPVTTAARRGQADNTRVAKRGGNALR
jgi:Lrp/AsnC family transcriptional regulator, leucine-responsive regulatory protein